MPNVEGMTEHLNDENEVNDCPFRNSSFQTPFVEFDQIEISPNIFAPATAGMFYAARFDPVQNCVIVLETMNCLFEGIALDFEKAEEMLVEADGLVVVAVEQAFAMQLGLVDQTREMNVAAEFFVWTARMQSSHGGKPYVAGKG